MVGRPKKTESMHQSSIMSATHGPTLSDDDIGQCVAALSGVRRLTAINIFK